MFYNTYRVLVIFMASLLLVNITACQKTDNNDHVFKAQEKALKKAQNIQHLIDQKFARDRKQIQEATN